MENSYKNISRSRQQSLQFIRMEKDLWKDIHLRPFSTNNLYDQHENVGITESGLRIRFQMLIISWAPFVITESMVKIVWFNFVRFEIRRLLLITWRKVKIIIESEWMEKDANEGSLESHKINVVAPTIGRNSIHCPW